MAAYFVSDIHLRTADEPKTTTLNRFLTSLLEQRRAGSDPSMRLFLVGDIFDLWIGSHDYFRAKFAETAELIRSLVDAGVETHFFEGNHDLHLTGFWERELGARVHGGPSTFSIEGFRVRVEHGDQMNPDDGGYLFLRGLLRTWPVRLLALNLPARLVSWIGEWASGLSRRHPGVRPVEAIRAMARAHASAVHASEPFDYLIAGHVHVVEDAALPGGGRVINLGCWDEKPMVFRLDPSGGEWLWASDS